MPQSGHAVVAVPRRRGGAALLATLVVATLVSLPGQSQAAEACGTSNGFVVCLSTPASTLTGDVNVSVEMPAATAAIRSVIFSWGPTADTAVHLLSDFEAPYGFTWRTDRYRDATGWLNVRVERVDDSVGTPVAVQATLSNGNATSVPQNPRDWPAVFTPRPSTTADPVVAAVGDSADGTASSSRVAASVAASSASILLYLGDMYERGTPAEWDANYGRSALEGGQTWDWGALAGWTRPTLGNHEAHNLEVWRDYWHGIPNWETFVYGGVRFLNLNSECALVGGCGPGSPQYAFAQQVLAQNTHGCIVTMWHRPMLSGGTDTTAMNALWALLANNGGDLVLNGHVHTMQRFRPMDADRQINQPDSHMVELISGAGTHNLTQTRDPDPRSEWQVTTTAGVAYLTLEGGGAGDATAISWTFRDADGQPIAGSDSRVACTEGLPDTTPPTTPGKPAAALTATGRVAVTWPASSDDRATSLTYSVFRDGGAAAVGTVVSSSTSTVSFTDAAPPPGTHTYEVSASDGTNDSGRSVASDPITVGSSEVVVFRDGFESGLGAWTNVANLTLDGTRAPPAGTVPSVRASVTNLRASAQRSFGATYPSVCAEAAVNLASASGTVALMKLRTSGGTSIGRLYVDGTRRLRVRADVSGAVFSPTATLATGWHVVELCGTVGASGSWSLSVDGTSVGAWTANNGTTPFGRVQIGDETAKTVTVNFDDVAVTVP